MLPRISGFRHSNHHPPLTWLIQLPTAASCCSADAGPAGCTPMLMHSALSCRCSAGVSVAPLLPRRALAVRSATCACSDALVTNTASRCSRTLANLRFRTAASACSWTSTARGLPAGAPASWPCRRRFSACVVA
jgi:hypothetical protein